MHAKTKNTIEITIEHGSERVFMGTCLVQVMDIANIIAFQKRITKISIAMQKMKSLKKFLCTQERVRREYRGLIFYVC
jgi:hypothetical protein